MDGSINFQNFWKGHRREKVREKILTKDLMKNSFSVNSFHSSSSSLGNFKSIIFVSWSEPRGILACTLPSYSKNHSTPPYNKLLFWIRFIYLLKPNSFILSSLLS